MRPHLQAGPALQINSPQEGRWVTSGNRKLPPSPLQDRAGGGNQSYWQDRHLGETTSQSQQGPCRQRTQQPDICRLLEGLGSTWCVSGTSQEQEPPRLWPREHVTRGGMNHSTR